MSAPAIPSPRYSMGLNRRTGDFRSDAAVAALAALKHVASLDPDGARLRNGMGFSRSDAARGHLLAGLSPESLRLSPALAGEVLRMAARYRKQVPGGQAYAAGLTDQGRLF